MAPEHLHIAYLPSTGYVHPILNALSESSAPEAAAAIHGWTSAGVGQLAVALSTKLVLLSIAQRRLGQALSVLRSAAMRAPDALLGIEEGKSVMLADRDLVYETLVDLDSFVFEFRSGYEILGKFVIGMYRLLGKKAPSESDLQSHLESRGIPTAWIGVLRERRIVHFHSTPPWIVFEVLSKAPLELTEIVTAGPSMRPEDIASGLPLKGLVDIHEGMARALQALQDRMIEEVRALRADPERSA